jgi:hypothetical protein
LRRWTLSIIRWGTDIYLTPEEERTAGPITYLGYAALALTNDLFSWPKEKRAHLRTNGNVPLVNAVDVLMKSQSLSENAAKALLKAKIREHEERYCQLRDEYLSSPNPSPAIVRWFSCLEFSIAGNFVWSLQTTRYWATGETPYHGHWEQMKRTSQKASPLAEVSSSHCSGGTRGKPPLYFTVHLPLNTDAGDRIDGEQLPNVPRASKELSSKENGTRFSWSMKSRCPIP